MISQIELFNFVSESNRIEGILRAPTQDELTITDWFLSLPKPSLEDLIKLVAVYQPDAVLRTENRLNVQVGSYIAPPGGPDIKERLERILATEFLTFINPWVIHLDYENLHPFTDGNGRSGRALWAWIMVRRQSGLPLGFLHQFYYQTLAADPLGSR